MPVERITAKHVLFRKLRRTMDYLLKQRPIDLHAVAYALAAQKEFVNQSVRFQKENINGKPVGKSSTDVGCCEENAA